MKNLLTELITHPTILTLINMGLGALLTYYTIMFFCINNSLLAIGIFVVYCLIMCWLIIFILTKIFKL